VRTVQCTREGDDLRFLPLTLLASALRGRGPAPDLDGDAPAGAESRPPRFRWWAQIAGIAVFYAAYTVIRDLRGVRPTSGALALRNAHRIIALERFFGIYHEAAVQHLLIGDRWLMRLLDDWYGSTHFIVTAGVLAAVYFTRRSLYRRWRDTLAVATALALIGFAWFPLMPPRLLPASYGFTDTLRTIGGLWSFNSGPMPKLSDQFAAMPSLHVAWAIWSAAAAWSATRRWWVRVLAVAYPLVTVVSVVASANHYFADALAGGLIILAGYGAARLGERWRSRRRPEHVPARVSAG
jgi:hypothetical protein